MASYSKRVVASEDDGQKDPSLSPPWDWSYTGVWYYVGYWLTRSLTGVVRFRNVTIPQGATITSAYLILEAAITTEDYYVYKKIYGIDEDNTADFSSDPTGRDKTSVSVDWEGGDTIGGDDYTTPDISDVFQEIINRDGWSSGNSIGFFLEDNGSTGSNRHAYKEYDAPVGNPCRLVVHYTTERKKVNSVKADIYVVGANDSSAKSNILVTDNTQVNSALANIPIPTQTHDSSAKANINTPQDNSAKADIIATQSQHTSAKARIHEIGTSQIPQYIRNLTIGGLKQPGQVDSIIQSGDSYVSTISGSLLTASGVNLILRDTASSSNSVDDGDRLVFTLQILPEVSGTRLWGTIHGSFYQGDVITANQIPIGSNISAGNWEMSIWEDWGSTDDDDIVQITCLKNNTGSTQTVTGFVNARLIVNKSS